MQPISLACALALGISLAAGIAPTHAAGQAGHAAASTTAPKLHAAMRELWLGHVEHARAYATAVKAGDAAAAGKAAEAVVANARQIADAVGGFYGAAAGQQMLTLLAGHWGGVKALTDARHAGDAAAADKAMNQLTANAGEIAKFLSGANPNLPDDAVRSLLLAHVAHHSEQIDAIMRGDARAEAATWSAMKAHMDTIADALADGIAKQFPGKAA
jgi:hypothetical protein